MAWEVYHEYQNAVKASRLSPNLDIRLSAVFFKTGHLEESERIVAGEYGHQLRSSAGESFPEYDRILPCGPSAPARDDPQIRLGSSRRLVVGRGHRDGALFSFHAPGPRKS